MQVLASRPQKVSWEMERQGGGGGGGGWGGTGGPEKGRQHPSGWGRLGVEVGVKWGQGCGGAHITLRIFEADKGLAWVRRRPVDLTCSTSTPR